MSGRGGTAVNQRFGEAHARRVLLGDPRKPESATHIIEFPGGAIEVSRLDDGDYWVHVIVNRGQVLGEDGSLRESARGEVIDSRVDWASRGAAPIPEIAGHGDVSQIAVRVRPIR